MENKNQKPLSLIIDDTRLEIAEVINKSGLTPSLLEPILRGFYDEMVQLKKKEIATDRERYEQILKVEETEK